MPNAEPEGKKAQQKPDKGKILSICNVIYHNLRLARHSVNELNYLLNNPWENLRFHFCGFPHFYFGHFIDIHSRNATILLHALIKGDLSITKLINVCENEIESIDFLLPKMEMKKIFKISLALIDEQKTKHWKLLSAARDKYAGHLDKINAGPIKEIGDIVFPLTAMQELLPKLEQAFAYIYYPLSGQKYELLPESSFIQKAITLMVQENARLMEEMAKK